MKEHDFNTAELCYALGQCYGALMTGLEKTQDPAFTQVANTAMTVARKAMGLPSHDEVLRRVGELP